MSLLLRFLAGFGCLIGVSFLMGDLAPATASRTDSESSAPVLPPPAIPAVLLARPDVQCELGIDDAQAHVVHEWLLEIRDHARVHRPRFDAMPINSERELEAYLQVQRAFSRQEIDRSEIGLSERLSQEQLQRLRQLSLQREGLSAFRRREIIDGLELTTEQQEQIEQLSALGLSPHSAPEVASRIRLDLANLLTDGQRQTWDDLSGELFLFDHAVPFGFEGEVMCALTGLGDQVAAKSESPEAVSEAAKRNRR